MAAARIDAGTLRTAGTLLLFLVIGAEVAALAALLPDTCESWFHPESAGYGDFDHMYANAATLSPNGLNSPGASALLYPLTFFGIRTAWTVYFGANVVALIAVACIAQRGATSMPAKVAVVLGVLALPQTHWALRVGHFTELLALIALGGFLLTERRPFTAGVLIAMLALKPQYLPVPLLYLAWTRNSRALAGAGSALCALTIGGTVAIAVDGGFGEMAMLYGNYARALPQDVFGSSVILHPAQQSWQYSWEGFLISTGADPHPLAISALWLVSAMMVLLAWMRCSPSIALAAAALGMVLLAPYATFYNWSLIAVAGALLLRSDLRPRGLAGAMLGMMAIAAAATQQATPFPIIADRFTEAETRGLYWLQPAALACLAILAALGGRRTIQTTATEPAPSRPKISMALAPAAAVTVAAGFIAAAWVSSSGPFAHDRYFNEGVVVAALPADFPLPEGTRITDAGRGAVLPYRIEWSTDISASEVAGAMRVRLDDGRWDVFEERADGDRLHLRSTRQEAATAPVLAEVEIEPSSNGSRVSVEFAPVPATLVPGYDDWLLGIGILVRDVPPGSRQ